MAKIANPDRTVMNRLYASEVSKMTGGRKLAGDGINSDQAFKDHEEFTKTLDKILAEDSKTEFDPNDPILD